MEKHKLTTEPELKRIGKRMRQLRKEKGFSSAEKFSYLSELDRAQYGKYEVGKIDFRISSFVKILNALNISWVDFFSEGFDDTNQE